MEKKIRIVDIARMAGVSPGTVDRVLHKRGRVSESSKKKVLDILAKTNYQPNLIARTLSAGRTQNIAVVMPDPAIDPFWKAAENGLEDGEKAFSPFGLNIQTYYFNPGRIRSFSFVAKKSIEARPDGILIAPFFQKESAAYIRSANLAGIPCITFNARLKSMATRSFIGQDLYQSGRLAAHLMTNALQLPTQIFIIHVEEDLQNSVHLKEKESGFRSYLREKYGGKFNIERLEFRKGKSVPPSFVHALENDPEAQGLFVTTSKAYRIVETLEKHRLNGVKIIGYDLLPDNLHYLEKGMIRFLIHQHPGLQTYLGLSFFNDLLIFKKEIPGQKLLPIDIITAENMNDYKTGINLVKCI